MTLGRMLGKWGLDTLYFTINEWKEIEYLVACGDPKKFAKHLIGIVESNGKTINPHGNYQGECDIVIREVKEH